MVISYVVFPNFIVSCRFSSVHVFVMIIGVRILVHVLISSKATDRCLFLRRPPWVHMMLLLLQRKPSSKPFLQRRRLPPSRNDGICNNRIRQQVLHRAIGLHRSNALRLNTKKLRICDANGAESTMMSKTQGSQDFIARSVGGTNLTRSSLVQ